MCYPYKQSVYVVSMVFPAFSFLTYCIFCNFVR
nr:MAG TPA: hypothetical protein [Caudoviricetes sp.]